jgi:hypothetical protein
MARNYTPKRLIHVTGIETVSEILRAIPEELRSKITAQAVAAEVDTEAIMIDIRTKRTALIPSIETTRREVRTQREPAVSSES